MKVVKRLRLSQEHAEFIRDYSKAKGISETRAISNIIDNELRRSKKQRLITLFDEKDRP